MSTMPRGNGPTILDLSMDESESCLTLIRTSTSSTVINGGLLESPQTTPFQPQRVCWAPHRHIGFPCNSHGWRDCHRTQELACSHLKVVQSQEHTVTLRAQIFRTFGGDLHNT